MHPFHEMKAYIRFDEADAQHLQRLWPSIEPHVRNVTRAFYDRILEFPEARAVFQDEAQVDRLRRTLEDWLQELFLGPHDLAYFDRRTRIGRRHVEVGLAHRYMFTAMSHLRDTLCDIAAAEVEAEQASQVCRAIQKVTTLDLAIMTGAFATTHEAEQLSTLRDLLVSNLPVTIMLVNQQGHVCAATSPGDVLRRDVELLGLPYDRALPAALVDAAELPDKVADALSNDTPVRLPRVDAAVEGALRSFKIDVVPLRHRSAAFLVHIEELTDAVATEAQLRRHESLAQLGSLSAAVAHELRNPLAGISGAVQVIAQSLATDDRRRPIMDKVLAQIGRLNRMVHDLLAFARPKEPRIAEVDLCDVARSVRDLVEGSHPQIRLMVDGAGAALGDADQLHRVLLNLVENAAQAMDEAGRIEMLIEGPRITVADDGPGVPDDLTTRIFEPFYTTRTQGTGLGLAICRSSVETMGGALDLVPSPLGGAAFRVTLRPPA